MKFADWVQSQGWTWTRAAKELGLANATAARRFAYGTIPNRKTMARIVRLSRGAVMPNDFYELTDRGRNGNAGARRVIDGEITA